jgi:hypothetical protein
MGLLGLHQEETSMRTRFNYWDGNHLPALRWLSPGVLDRRAIEVFRAGQCHSFALAMQQLTGGHLVAEQHGRELTHLLVFDPDSRLLVDADITWAIGPATSAAFRVLKRAPPFGRLTTSWFPLQVEDAIPFAVTRLTQIEKRRR